MKRDPVSKTTNKQKNPTRILQYLSSMVGLFRLVQSLKVHLDLVDNGICLPFFGNSHLNTQQCEVKAHCAFYLLFRDSQWRWSSFYIIIGHWCVFFGEMSLQIPRLIWVHRSLILASGRQKQLIFEFETSLVHRTSSMTDRVTQGNPVSNNNNKTPSLLDSRARFCFVLLYRIPCAL